MARRDWLGPWQCEPVSFAAFVWVRRYQEEVSPYFFRMKMAQGPLVYRSMPYRLDKP